MVHSKRSVLRDLGVEKLGLFGSVARGDNTVKSDYDILVTFTAGTESYRNFLKVIELLESNLNAPVDLVTEAGLSPYIGRHILKEVQYVSLLP